MKPGSKKPTLNAAAARLRTLALATPPGEFVGAEDDLIKSLDISRVTLRQAARLLEREGVLQVRRGANGGYFSARPDTQTIEGVLSAYLDALKLNVEETFVVGFALWEEAVRQASRVKNPETAATIEHFRKRLDALPADAPIFEIFAFEEEYRRAIFDLAKLPYLQLIFQLNRAVSWRCFLTPPWESSAPEPDFLNSWREVKRIELAALLKGEEEVAIAAATRDRELFQERMFATGLASKRNL